MSVLFNEIEPFAVEWLRNLSKAGHIAEGVVDERSIRDIRAGDLRAHTQAHFFAGIGVWSRALRLAGWPDDVPVWTGSCPCQPFSAAGKRGGFDDERHLWPEWFRLIGQCRPPIIFGEQVASPDGLKWFDAVSADLEGAGYAFAAADLCAAGVGAPHIRQRLYWVAVTRDQRREGLRLRLQSGQPRPAAGGGGDGELAHHHHHQGLEGRQERRDGADERTSGSRSVAGFVGDPSSSRSGRHPGAVSSAQGEGESGREESGSLSDLSLSSGTNGFWSPAEWIPCRDGKARPVEPGTFPLVDGAPGRVGRLRAYGNAIVAPLAAEFIRSVMEIL